MIWSGIKDELIKFKLDSFLVTKMMPPKQSGPLGYGILGDLLTYNDFLTHVIPFDDNNG